MTTRYQTGRYHLIVKHDRPSPNTCLWVIPTHTQVAFIMTTRLRPRHDSGLIFHVWAHDKYVSEALWQYCMNWISLIESEWKIAKMCKWILTTLQKDFAGFCLVLDGTVEWPKMIGGFCLSFFDMTTNNWRYEHEDTLYTTCQLHTMKATLQHSFTPICVSLGIQASKQTHRSNFEVHQQDARDRWLSHILLWLPTDLLRHDR